ncbi:MAG: hypothetical protein ACE5SW_01940 [Nitrososphaeraceae archaeon]
MDPKRIDQMTSTAKKAALFINTIGQFTKWSANTIRKNTDSMLAGNISRENAESNIQTIEESYSILEDFVKSNEHIIKKIKKIRFENKE